MQTWFFPLMLLLAHLLPSSLADASEATFPSNGFDEGTLFSDTGTVVDTSTNFQAVQDSQPDRKTVGLSGTILAFGQTTAQRDYWPDWDAEKSALGSGAVGNALLDVRMQRGFRAFADLEWSLDPALAGDSAVRMRIPETFLDANINHKIWFRMGKQVLQWGRGWFFNPTDLINVERKSFFQRIGNREGVFGAKVHVPFGTTANFYGFLDANETSRPDSLSGAVKAEFLAGGTEFAVMAWDGGGRDPVYGADLSSRFLGLDITAEAALHQTFLSRRIQVENGFPTVVEKRMDWQSRLAFGLGRSFDVNGIPNRITTVAEYYYNQPGSLGRKMPFAELMRLAGQAGMTQDQVQAAAQTADLYEPNSYSQHYAAFFATFSRFIRSDLTLSVNALANLNQHCGMLTSALTYQDLNDFSLTLSLNGFAGPGNREYTLAGQALQIQILAQAAY